jgi:hypothetical protein
VYATPPRLDVEDIYLKHLDALPSTVDEKAFRANVAARNVEAAQRFPGQVWAIEEPSHDIALIDSTGAVWAWTNPEPGLDDEDGGLQWTRHVYSMRGDGKYMVGPSLGDEWEDVLAYGPVRYATEEDLPLVWRFEYTADDGSVWWLTTPQIPQELLDRFSTQK